jgi:hypothetical protein
MQSQMEGLRRISSKNPKAAIRLIHIGSKTTLPHETGQALLHSAQRGLP